MYNDNMRIEMITIPANRRDVDFATVERLAESMSRLGLLNRIVVFLDEDKEECWLVAGAHRFAAAKLLGWEYIDCTVVDPARGESLIEAEMVEITENLHRRELTKLERAEQNTRWVELCEAKEEKSLLAQLAPSVNKDGKRKGRQHKPSGVRQASRELQIDRDELMRSKQIASLSPEAKLVAVQMKHDDNQSKLLKAAKLETPEAQVAFLKGVKAEKEPTEKPRKSAAVVSEAPDAVAKPSDNDAEAEADEIIARLGEEQALKLAEAIAARVGAHIDANTLPMSAQKKIEAAKRRAVDAALKEIEQKHLVMVYQEVERQIAETEIPRFYAKFEHAEEVAKSHRGFMNEAEYKAVLRCLHPDSRASVSDEKLAEAFRIIKGAEIPLLPGAATAPAAPKLPSREELLKMREQRLNKKTAKAA